MSEVKNRFIILVENREGGYKPCDRATLVNLLRDNISGLDHVRLIDVRVASRHIEFDLLVYSSFANLCLILDFLENNIGTILEVKYVSEDEEYGIIEETLTEAVKLFNEERFWEFHEILEPIWRMSKDDEKELLHGLILTAAAFVNYQKCKIDRAFSIFTRALAKLPKSQSVYYGIDISELRRRIENILDSRTVKPFRLIMHS